MIQNLEVLWFTVVSLSVIPIGYLNKDKEPADRLEIVHYDRW